MIPRYSRPEMARIWELQNKFAIWQEIEILACEAQAELGDCGITLEEAEQIRERAGFSVERIDELEASSTTTSSRSSPTWPSTSASRASGSTTA